MQLKLVIEHEAGMVSHQEFTLTNAETLIGRSITSDLVLPDETCVISRKHAKIRLEGQYYFITDLGSHNRSYLNSRAIEADTPYPLHVGDVIQIGRYQMQVQVATKVPNVKVNDVEELALQPLQGDSLPSLAKKISRLEEVGQENIGNFTDLKDTKPIQAFVRDDNEHRQLEALHAQLRIENDHAIREHESLDEAPIQYMRRIESVEDEEIVPEEVNELVQIEEEVQAHQDVAADAISDVASPEIEEQAAELAAEQVAEQTMPVSTSDALVLDYFEAKEVEKVENELVAPIEVLEVENATPETETPAMEVQALVADEVALENQALIEQESVNVQDEVAEVASPIISDEIGEDQEYEDGEHAALDDSAPAVVYDAYQEYEYEDEEPLSSEEHVVEGNLFMPYAGELKQIFAGMQALYDQEKSLERHIDLVEALTEGLKGQKDSLVGLAVLAALKKKG